MTAKELRQTPKSALQPMIVDRLKASWAEEAAEDDNEGALQPAPPEEPPLAEEDLRGFYQHPHFTPMEMDFHEVSLLLYTAFECLLQLIGALQGQCNLEEGFSDSLDLFLLFYPPEQVQVFVDSTNQYVENLPKVNGVPFYEENSR